MDSTFMFFATDKKKNAHVFLSRMVPYLPERAFKFGRKSCVCMPFKIHVICDSHFALDRMIFLGIWQQNGVRNPHTIEVACRHTLEECDGQNLSEIPRNFGRDFQQ